MSKKAWVIVTGGGTRLGELFVDTVAQKGYNVLVHYSASEKGAKTVVEKVCNQYGVLSECIQWDFQEWNESVLRRWEEISNKNVVGLINNASYYEKGNWISSKIEDFYTMMQINTFVPMRLGNWLFQTSKQGWIINILDAGTNIFCREYQNYYETKKILRQFTYTQAQMFAPKVRVNGIAPGPVIPSVNNDGTRFNEQIKQTLLKKKVCFEDLSAAVNFLIETESLTGQILEVDAGLHLKT